MAKTISLTLKVWRQKGPNEPGRFETYEARNISTDASFLEMLDIVNKELTLQGKEPIAFDHDCREGICGSCGAVVNGHAHGHERETTLCQLHMRKFRDGDVLVIEPWRSRVFPVIKDLIVDRSALDRIIASGVQDKRPTPTPFRSRKSMRMPPSKPRSVSAAAHAWRLVRMGLRCFLSQPK